VVGWPLERGCTLVGAISEHCVQPHDAYSHRWRRHDLVMCHNAVCGTVADLTIRRRIG
jgi:alpha-ketoglutarate-dependent taurine dioxygenase